jgi:hypothetical protein
VIEVAAAHLVLVVFHARQIGPRRAEFQASSQSFATNAGFNVG